MVLFSVNCGYAELSTPGNDSVPMVEALGDTDLPVQGTTFTFRCPPGRALIGPNSTTCTETGEWEPDPSEAMCMGKSDTMKHFKFHNNYILLCSCMRGSTSESQSVHGNATFLRCSGPQ